MSKLIIFDLDGTLADIRHRRHFVDGSGGKADWDGFFRACVDDAPNGPVIEVFGALVDGGTNCKVEIWSGRSDIVREETLEWLKKHRICRDYVKLRMRPHGDYRPDVELKRQWAEEVGIENIFMVFDDRKRLVEMWRKMGITCLQVAEGDF